MPVEFSGERYRQVSAHQQEWGTRLIEELQLRGDEEILDVGCGDGRLTRTLSGLVPDGSVLGIDASAGMIESAQSLATATLRFEWLDVLDAHFDGRFDLVFSNAALHWVLDHDRLMMILHRALRPGGRLRVNFAGDGNCRTFYEVVRGLMATPAFADAFAGFRWPWYMPPVPEVEERMARSPFPTHRVWGENADRYFPDEEAMLGWIDHPSIVPFRQHLDGEQADRFHQAVAREMVERTRQPDGTCFETFRRVNVLATR